MRKDMGNRQQRNHPEGKTRRGCGQTDAGTHRETGSFTSRSDTDRLPGGVQQRDSCLRPPQGPQQRPRQQEKITEFGTAPTLARNNTDRRRGQSSSRRCTFGGNNYQSAHQKGKKVYVTDSSEEENTSVFGDCGIRTSAHDPAQWNALAKKRKTFDIPHPWYPPESRPPRPRRHSRTRRSPRQTREYRKRSPEFQQPAKGRSRGREGPSERPHARDEERKSRHQKVTRDPTNVERTTPPGGTKTSRERRPDNEIRKGHRKVSRTAYRRSDDSRSPPRKRRRGKGSPQFAPGRRAQQGPPSVPKTYPR